VFVSASLTFHFLFSLSRTCRLDVKVLVLLLFRVGRFFLGLSSALIGTLAARARILLSLIQLIAAGLLLRLRSLLKWLALGRSTALVQLDCLDHVSLWLAVRLVLACGRRLFAARLRLVLVLLGARTILGGLLLRLLDRYGVVLVVAVLLLFYFVCIFRLFKNKKTNYSPKITYFNSEVPELIKFN
jgi:hypothetical protein